MSRDTWADVYNEDMSCEQLPLPDNLADAHRTIRELQLQIERMQRQLEQLLRQRHGPKNEKHHNEQLLLFGESAVELPPASPQPEPNAKVGHGRQKLPASLPRQEIVHDLTPEQKLCPECGIERQPMGEESSEQLEYIPAGLKVLVHKRPKYACADCQGHVAVAARLPEPIERGLPGVGLLAHVIVSKFMDHLPLYRQERIFQRQGVSLSRQTTCGWLAQCAGLLEPIWKAMKARILLSKVVMTDDTTVPVQDPDVKGKNRTARFWAYLGDRDHRFVVFDYSTDRRGDWPEAFLKDYTSGYLQSDAYSGYDRLHARGLVAVGCWAHARRKFHDAISSDKTRAEEALDWIGRLYGVERAVKGEASQRLSTLGREPSDVERQAMDDQVRAEARDKNSREILNGFSLWLESRVVQVLPKSPMGEAIGYARSNWQALNRYLEAPWLSIDNNASERAIRPIAIGRKNWLHLGSDAGGRTAAILLSVTQSARELGLEPWSYLRDVLARVSTHPHSRIAELLPDRWGKPEIDVETGRKG
jgi:transposase